MEIPLWHPSFTSNENQAIQNVLSNGYLGMGRDVFEFEKNVAKEIGVKESLVVATHTGQSALHTILESINQTNEKIELIITPSMNNIADFQAIIASDIRLYFADCNAKNGLLNFESIPREIRDKADALIVLDYASNYVDLEYASKFCKSNNMKLIYDACHSFGSVDFNRISRADATLFSFDPIKTFTAIDAGIIIWKDLANAKSSRAIRHMGMEQDLEELKVNGRSSDYDVKLKGFRYHLSNVHAACGSAQIKRKNYIIERRNYIANLTRKELEGCKLIEGWIPIDKNFAPFMNVALIKSNLKIQLMEKLKKLGIQTGVHWKPGHYFTKFSNVEKALMQGTEEFYSKILSIPLFTDMNELHNKYLVDSIFNCEKELM